MMFADRLIQATRRLGPLCVGIDPHPGRIPALFGGDTPRGIADWGKAVIEAAVGQTGIVKPQSALFERHGPDGMRALQEVCAAARDAGLLVLMDAKRGDIGSTAEGYARTYLSADAPYACDALTVNPYMGLDTIEPFIAAAEQAGRGIAVLARTSNPGSADFQARDLEGAPLYQRVVEGLQPFSGRLKGETGWSGLMLVAGATGPEEARRLRALTPDMPFLVPGYGAQGAGAADAVAGFVAGSDGRLEGGVVNASRSVTFPDAATSATSLAEWRSAVSDAMAEAARALSAACDRS